VLTVHSVYTVGLHDNIGTWYTSNEKKCVCSRKKVLISGMRKESLVAVFLLLVIKDTSNILLTDQVNFLFWFLRIALDIRI
jgi:hypothetical protein